MTPAFEVIRNEFRLAARSLARRPAFTAIAVFTLAVGIAANTSIFSVVNGILLRPLPYRDADGLVMVNVRPTSTSDRPGNMSYPDLADLRDQGQSFASLVGVATSSFTLTGDAAPTIVDVARVTDGLMATFGVQPLLGRDITAAEFGPAAPQVVVISHGMWQERFGGAPDVLGRTLTLNGNAYEIVGVGPPGFDYPARATLWMPRSFDPQNCPRGCHAMNAIGRLAPGASLERAAVELERFGPALETEFPATNTGKRFMVRTLRTTMVGDVERGLWIMLGAVGLVVLIVCANVANLLLARASARQGELAVRTALGASRRRLAGPVLAECGVLALAGGTLGVALAFGGVAILRRFAVDTLPRADGIVIDGTVLLVTAGTILLVTVVFGLVPAFGISGTSLAEGMSQIGRSAAVTRRTLKFRRSLLAAEVALSAALLIGAGLLIRTFVEMQRVDVGFETRQVLRFNVVLSASAYPELERVSQFYGALESGIEALPGVEAAGTMFGAPFGQARTTGAVLVEGRPDPPPDAPDASVHPMTPRLLAALRINVRKGRSLTPADNRPDAEPVALVNEAFVRQQFPGEDPVDKRVRITVDMGFGSPLWRIVGVVGDVRSERLTQTGGPAIYMPHAQFGPRAMTVHARLSPGTPALLPAIRAVISRIDPNVAIHRVETLEQVMRRDVAPTRLYLLLIGAFAAVAALLAAVGLYGVVSFIVVQRTREIGIRVALGARRQGIMALVIGQGMQPVLIGLAAGVGAALIAGRLLDTMLYGVHERDPFVFIGATALMAVVALVAAAVPAVRASGIDPAHVLHGE